MEEQLPNLQISFWNRHLVKFIFVGIFIIASLIRFVGLADGKSFDISRAEIKEVVQVQQINGAVVYQNWPMLRLEGARFVLPKGFVHKNSENKKIENKDIQSAIQFLNISDKIFLL